MSVAYPVLFRGVPQWESSGDAVGRLAGDEYVEVE